MTTLPTSCCGQPSNGSSPFLGEALGRLRQLDAALGARISDLPRAVALRNLLVHAYADVDDRIVWGVVTGQLARLVAELDAI